MCRDPTATRAKLPPTTFHAAGKLERASKLSAAEIPEGKVQGTAAERRSQLTWLVSHEGPLTNLLTYPPHSASIYSASRGGAAHRVDISCKGLNEC